MVLCGKGLSAISILSTLSLGPLALEFLTQSSPQCLVKGCQ